VITACLALGGAVPATATALAPAEEAVAAQPDFCEAQQLVDYAAPLAGLSKLREPPKSGRLPFGPRRMRFAATNELDPFGGGGLVIAGGRITYRFTLAGSHFGPKRLNWIAESRLVRLNAHGRGVEVTKRRAERLGLLRVPSHGAPPRPRIIGFRRVDEPGIYRYDIVFRRLDGSRLGRYHSYYRVVSGNPETRLVLNGSSFRSGDLVLEKIENPGTAWVFYGAGNEGFERLEGAAWKPLDFESLFGRPNNVPAIGLALGPGFSGGCEFLGFSVPEAMVPGRYRVSKSFERPENGLRPTSERLMLTAEFTVLP
jgi:hypothetical protein